MNLTWIDWTIIAIAIVFLRLVSLSTRRYMKGVADFLSANRSAGRYLLTIAGAMGGTATISFVGVFEMIYSAGLPPIWWGFMSWATGAIIILSGWVYYRFRETRAMTLAQFFEMRYSRRFRILAGLVMWSCGLLNFGIFPAVAARFIIYFCGLPDVFHIPGIPIGIPTFPVVMALDLGVALTLVNMGGQISVMITDCVQGIISSLAMFVVVIAVLVTVQWPKIMAALATAPANASMLNPLKTSQVHDFNLWFFLIATFGAFYGYQAWQGTSGFNSSARTPHEQKMGAIIGGWRAFPQSLLIMLVPLAAYAVMHLPEYASTAAVVQATANGIQNEAVRSQMLVPIVMAHILPAGVKGLLAITMIFFSFTCHDTYMHSWGTIFIQDVVMPIRRRPLRPDQHIRLLRWSITGIALFAFFFSLFYPQTQKILFFFAITGTIWLGGAGACILGGLYWRKGTTAAAYSALILGSTVGVAGLVVPIMYKNHYHRDFPINGQYLWFMAMAGSLVVYCVVSILTNRGDYNLEKLLHRGKYSDHTFGNKEDVSRWKRLIGITPEFSRCDRFLAIAQATWSFGWFAVFLAGTLTPLIIGASDDWWPKFWRFFIVIQLILAVPGTIWFTIGGVIDIRSLFRTLKTVVRDDTDDGRVAKQSELAAEEQLADADC